MSIIFAMGLSELEEYLEIDKNAEAIKVRDWALKGGEANGNK